MTNEGLEQNNSTNYLIYLYWNILAIVSHLYNEGIWQKS